MWHLCCDLWLVLTGCLYCSHAFFSNNLLMSENMSLVGKIMKCHLWYHESYVLWRDFVSKLCQLFNDTSVDFFVALCSAASMLVSIIWNGCLSLSLPLSLLPSFLAVYALFRKYLILTSEVLTTASYSFSICSVPRALFIRCSCWYRKARLW